MKTQLLYILEGGKQKFRKESDGPAVVYLLGQDIDPIPDTKSMFLQMPIKNSGCFQHIILGTSENQSGGSADSADLFQHILLQVERAW